MIKIKFQFSKKELFHKLCFFSWLLEKQNLLVEELVLEHASCVGPGKSNLPFELRRKAGHCSRVTAGPIDLI